MPSRMICPTGCRSWNHAVHILDIKDVHITKIVRGDVSYHSIPYYMNDLLHQL